MSLTPPRQPSGAKFHRSGPDAEALLLEAVHHRRGHESLERLQRCVHRRGLDWLEQFQTLTLPAREGNDAAAWFAALLQDGLVLMPAEGQGTGEDQAKIEQRAAAAVDRAIASMLAEFPELVAQAQPIGFALPLTLAPSTPAMPQALPERTPPPDMSFTGAGDLASREAAGLPLEILQGVLVDEPEKEGSAFPEPLWPAALIDDHAPLEGAVAGSAELRQRSATEIGATLRSRLLRRLRRTHWRSLAWSRTDRGGAPQVPDPAAGPRFQPPAPEEFQGAVTTQSAAGATTVLAQDHISAAGNLPHPPAPVGIAVRLAERQSGSLTLQDAAPAPTALADLRAWLPDCSLSRAG